MERRREEMPADLGFQVAAGASRSGTCRRGFTGMAITR